jgi:hypothetical protein
LVVEEEAGADGGEAILVEGCLYVLESETNPMR